MGGLFSSRDGDGEGYDINEHARELSSAYWTFDAGEFDTLKRRIEEGLSPRETLRLLHLACMQMLESDAGKAQLASTDTEAAYKAPEGGHLHLLRAIDEMWLSTDNPYRGRCLAIWYPEDDPEETAPGWVAMTINNSLTHLGCLEVIRLDQDGDEFHAREVDFIPFGELEQFAIMAPATFAPGKVFLRGGREESVLIPLLYHGSHSTPNDSDRDGSNTRYVCVVEGLGGTGDRGVGVGVQELLGRGPGGDTGTLALSLASWVFVTPDIWEEDFEAHCAERGLDAQMIRAIYDAEDSADSASTSPSG